MELSKNHFDLPQNHAEDFGEEELLQQRLFLESYEEQIVGRARTTDKPECSNEEATVVMQDALVCITEITEDLRELLHIKDSELGQMTDPAFDAVQEIVRHLTNISKLKPLFENNNTNSGTNHTKEITNYG